MVRFKKLLSIFMVSVLGVSAFAACAPDADSAADKTSSVSAERGELNILKTDVKISPEDRLSLMKAEYLIENHGYKDDDEVVAILSLEGDALIDSYLADEELSAKVSLADYAASPMGKQKLGAIGTQQSDLVRRLQSERLIKEVGYRYSTVLNAVSVTMTYGNFLKVEEGDYCAYAALSETYSHPQEATGTDASAIVNDVKVYETGIFNPEDAVDPSGNPYTGKGTSVAVLDSGFDLSHPVFNTHVPDGDPMYTASGISEKVNAKGTDGTPLLNAAQTTRGLAVSDVYYSKKIPYKYDYADKDPDVFPFDSEHGTHVAGIIGGYADSYTDKDGKLALDKDGNEIHFKGIAADTQLVLLKVFKDLQAGAETEDILAALEDAVTLGVDAVNMSLGSACGFAREEDEEYVSRVYEKVDASGVSLITAAGNEFSSGYGGEQGNTNRVTNPDSGTIGSPSSYIPALSVASISGVKSKYLIGNRSSDGKEGQVFFFNESSSISGEENDFYGELYSDIQNKGAKYGLTEQQVKERYGNVAINEDGTLELEYVTVPGYGYRANYTAVDVRGKIALVSRGDNTFEDKALQAKNAGAIGCIIYNNIEGDIRMSMGKTDHIPAISISKEDGVALAQRRTGTLTFSYDQEAGPFMSDFSCWGPLPDLTLKPEITAHGGNITSSVPGGGYYVESGTSMACPNLCGIVVLIRQYIKDNYEKLTGEQDTEGDSYMLNIKNLTNKLLMSTATIILNEQGNPYSPRKQGAGLASLYNVVNTKAYLQVEENGEVKERTKIELGDDPERKGVYEMYFNVANISDEQVAYDVGIIGMTESVSTADNDFVAERDQLLGGSIKVEALSEGGSVNGTSVTVEAGKTLKLKLTHTLDEEDKDLIDSLFPYGMYVEGFVTLTAKEEGEIDLNVPFLAFFGDWTQAPIFDKTFYEVETEAHNAGIDEEDKLKADYYATMPLGSYWYNYYYPLGTYLYNMDESVYDPIPATEDHITIADSLGSIDGIALVYAGLLRSCKELIYTITDKTTGEVIFEYVDYNTRKAHSQGGSPIPGFSEDFDFSAADYNLVNNRVYEFKMEGRLDYGDDGGAAKNARSSFSFDFTFDSEAPVIKSATYEKEYDKTLKKDRYYVTLTLFDNCCAMAIQPGLFIPNPEYGVVENVNPFQFSPIGTYPIPLYGEKGKDYSVRIEITDYLPNLKYSLLDPQNGVYLRNCIAFLVEDYSINQNIFLCQLPGTNGEFTFTKDGTENGTLLNEVTIGVNEVKDLTQYLCTTDGTVDENKDYLKYLTWTSDNSRIASVENGQVLGLSVGTTKITVTNEFYDYSATISVRVVNKGTATAAVNGEDRGISLLSADDVADASQEIIKDIRFSYFDTNYAHAMAGHPSSAGTTNDRNFLTAYRGGISLYPGESITLHYDVSPWYVRDDGRYLFKFESSRPDVLSVDADKGAVMALKEGNATITLRIYDPKNYDPANPEGNKTASNLMASLRVTVESEFVIDDARTLVAYKGLGGDVVIPDDEGILYVGPFCFSLYEVNRRYAQELPDDDRYANYVPQQNATITSVTVPEGVTEIQQDAFRDCTALREVKLPSSIRFLRQNTFRGDTALEKINLEDVEAVGAYAFYGCEKLKDFGAGEATADKPLKVDMMYSIGVRSFAGCTSLTNIDLTKLRNAGEGAFMGCSKLEKVTLGPLTKLSEHIFDGCGLTTLECYESNIIPAYAFANNKLTSVTLASEGGLDLIGDCAFANNTSLAQITLPNSPFALGQGVFAGCTGLEKVILQAKTLLSAAQGALFTGSGVTTFEITGTNENYSLSSDSHLLLNTTGTDIVLAAVNAYKDQELTLQSSITRVGPAAFAGAEITSLTFSSPIVLGENAFAGCKKLAKVTFAAGENEIGNAAFLNCDALTSVENLGTAVRIGDRAFAYAAKLANVTIGPACKVGEEAFTMSGLSGSALTEITIGKDAEIGASAFKDCTELLKVNMPADGGVKIGASAFSGDFKLTTADLSKATGEIGDEAFFGCPALTAANLTNITKIGKRAFANCANLATLTLGNSLTDIGEGAFMDYNLFMSGSNVGFGPTFSQVTFPATLENLGARAFYGCKNITSVSLPAGIDALADGVFAYCTSLGTVTLNACVKIGSRTFEGCSALSTIGLEKVQTVGNYAFYNAGNSSATFDLTAMTTVGDYAFAGSKAVFAGEGEGVQTTVNAPALTHVGAHAFERCSFSTLNAPKLAVIGEGAFQNNQYLISFNLYDTIESVGDAAFLGCANLQDITFGAEKAKDGEINGYAKLIDGALYTSLENGKLRLASIPAGKNPEGGKFVVAEGTTYISKRAGSENRRISALVLPDSLECIGEYAFYGYTALKSVEFRSVSAPALENTATGTTHLGPNHPGYNVLHNQYGLYRFEEICYYNFIDHVGMRDPIKMILPKNDDISGYDNIVYLAYFGSVANATRSDYTAMEQSMKDFLVLGKQVAAIETVTLNDEALISDAVVALNGVKQDPTAHGVSKEEWNTLSAAVTAARDRIRRLKVEYASKAVRDIQARIDALPDTYENTETQDALILALQAAIADLEIDDRSLLIQDKYTALLSAYTEAHPTQPTTPPSGGDDGNGDGPAPDDREGGFPVWAGVLIGVGAALVIAAAAVAVVFLLKKKNASPAAQENPEEAASPAEPDGSAPSEAQEDGDNDKPQE